MEALHARYPFLESARAELESSGLDLTELVATESAVVDRAMDRVRGAIEDGQVGAPVRSDRVELLSYPVARVLVSLLEEPGLVHRYARAEADAARDRFVADFDSTTELRSVGRDRISVERLLSELDVQQAIDLDHGSDVDDGRGASGDGDHPVPPVLGIEVGAFLQLTEELSEPRWALQRRSIADGTVTVSRDELYALLREAIRARVAAALPLAVPDPVAAELTDRCETLRTLIAEYDHEWDLGRVDPEAFPPCIEALLDRAGGEEPLSPHSRFSLVSFLLTAGMDTEEIRRLLDPAGEDGDRLGDRIDRLRDGDAAAYPPPSCATMVAYGDCVNRDALCERIGHPLAYYERRLAGETP